MLSHRNCSVNSQPILNCNMSNSRSKHPKSENNKFKPVREIISFSFNLRNGAILKKKEGVSISLFHDFEFLIAITFQLTTDFGLQYTKIQQLKNCKTKLVSDISRFAIFNKRVAFFGTPGSKNPLTRTYNLIHQLGLVLNWYGKFKVKMPWKKLVENSRNNPTYQGLVNLHKKNCLKSHCHLLYSQHLRL